MNSRSCSASKHCPQARRSVERQDVWPYTRHTLECRKLQDPRALSVTSIGMLPCTGVALSETHTVKLLHMQTRAC